MLQLQSCNGFGVGWVAKNEIKHCIDFDYFIINQDFDISVRELLSIIDSEKNKISNLNYSDVLTKLLN